MNNSSTVKTVKRSKSNLTQGNIWGQIIIFALPILLSNVVNQLYNMVDSIVVGKYINYQALAAVGANNTIANMMFCLFLGLGVGAGVVLSQYYGARDTMNIKLTVDAAMFLSLVCGIVLTIVGYFLARPLLILIDTPADVLEYSVEYLQIYFLGSVSVLFYNMCAGLLRAMGDSLSPFLYLLAGAVLNVGLDLYFVVDLNWGVAGAAWATIIAQTVSAAMCVTQLCLTKGPHRFSLRKMKINGGILAKVVKIGLPIGLQSGMFSIANLIIQANLNSFGSTVMAGWVAASKVDNFMYAPITCYGAAVNVFVGQNYGARLDGRVKKGTYIAIVYALATAVLLAIPFMLLRREIVTIFNDDPKVVEVGALAMLYIIPFYTLFGVTEVLSGTMRGVGKSALSAVMSLIGIFVVRLVWMYGAVSTLHTLEMLFLVYPVSWTAYFIIFVAFYLIRGWRGVLKPTKSSAITGVHIAEQEMETIVAQEKGD